MMIKVIEVALHDIESAGQHTTLLHILRDKGFPVKGGFLLDIDWDKVVEFEAWNDHKSGSTFYQWEEK